MDYEQYLEDISRDEYYNTPGIELLLKPQELDRFSNEHGLPYFFRNNAINEKINELKAELLKKVLKFKLTKHQRRVLNLHLKELTQEAIAKKTKTTQSAIHKCLYGNRVYDGGVCVKVYGGVVRKLQKQAFKNSDILEALHKIEQVKLLDLKEVESSLSYQDRYHLIKKRKG